MKEWINDEASWRTAQAISGLLKRMFPLPSLLLLIKLILQDLLSILPTSFKVQYQNLKSDFFLKDKNSVNGIFCSDMKRTQSFFKKRKSQERFAFGKSKFFTNWGKFACPCVSSSPAFRNSGPQFSWLWSNLSAEIVNKPTSHAVRRPYLKELN